MRHSFRLRLVSTGNIVRCGIVSPLQASFWRKTQLMSTNRQYALTPQFTRDRACSTIHANAFV